MKFTNVTAAMVLAMTLVAVPTAMAISPDSSSALQAPRVSKLKGTIKSLDATAAIVVLGDTNKSEISFQVSSATEKVGALESGASVEVSYYFSDGKRVATALTGK